MKAQLSAVLFAALLPLTACGGDRGNSTPTEHTRPSEGVVPTQPEVVKRDPTAEVKPAPVAVVAPGLVGPSKYVDCITEGKLLAAKGEHGRARALFEAAIKLDKKQVDPHVELARSYIATNERGLAIKSANTAVKLAPASSQAWNTLGRAELLRHNYDDAITAFRQATELDAGNVWAWNNLGFTYMIAKNYAEASTALVEATSKPGAEGYMFNNLGLAYEQLDQLDDARVAFDKGGELGSVEAKASRKRLEGVTTIVVKAEHKPAVKAEPEVEVKTYDTAEPMPDLPPTQDGDGTTDDSKPAPQLDEPGPATPTTL